MGGSPNLVCKVVALSIEKWQILTPRGAKIPEPILMKLDMVDYVRDPTPHDNSGGGKATWVVCDFHISEFLFFLSFFFTALHVMQTRYCDENSVCPSVRLSVCPTRVDCDKTVERSIQIYIPYERTFSLVF